MSTDLAGLDEQCLKDAAGAPRRQRAARAPAHCGTLDACLSSPTLPAANAERRTESPARGESSKASRRAPRRAARTPRTRVRRRPPPGHRRNCLRDRRSSETRRALRGFVFGGGERFAISRVINFPVLVAALSSRSAARYAGAIVERRSPRRGAVGARQLVLDRRWRERCELPQLLTRGRIGARYSHPSFRLLGEKRVSRPRDAALGGVAGEPTSPPRDLSVLLENGAYGVAPRGLHRRRVLEPLRRRRRENAAQPLGDP